MSSKTVLNRWANEFCSPVAVTVTTAEAENICRKNGLYLHELLSAFADLVGVNSSIRIGSQQYPILDAHIRFERVSEVRSKSTNIIEDLLKKEFEDFQMSKLPSNVAELRASPPSALGNSIEQILCRSMSFSEFEMLSQPYVLISVISSTDVDPVGAMQELSSIHHIPTCFSTGQYDPEIHRVYLILHDVQDAKNVDAKEIHRKIQSKFPPTRTRLLPINSLSESSMNTQQPDMWSSHLFPLFFQNLAPITEDYPILTNPIDGKRVLGARLSIDDFMTLREFCMNLYHQDILPCIERRIAILTKIVSDSRKGMKNVLKSFWRRPREETATNGRGSVIYRYDRVESQILSLADSSFLIKDYDTAISMYKLVRDDFRSDRSNIHLAHTLFMISVSYLMMEPNRTKEIITHLDTLSQFLATMTEPAHIIAYFALLASEIYGHPSFRMHLEAAQLLLQASTTASSRFPVLCGLLTEKAANHFLWAGHSRRFILHRMLSGYKFRSAGGLPAKYALVSFASAMVIHDQGRWGDIRAKLSSAISKELKSDLHSGEEGGAQRALIAALRLIKSIMNEELNITGRDSMNIVVAELKQLMWENGPWSASKVGPGWEDSTTRQFLMNLSPVTAWDASEGLVGEDGQPAKTVEVTGFVVPEVVKKSLSLLSCLNGMGLLVPLDGNISSTLMPYSLPCDFDPSTVPSLMSYRLKNGPTLLSQLMQAEELKRLMMVETQYNRIGSAKGGNNRSNNSSSSNNSNVIDLQSLDDVLLKWVEAEHEMQSQRYKYFNKNFRSTMLTISSTPISPSMQSSSTMSKLPLGEYVMLRVHLRNKLPCAITMSDVQLEVEPSCQSYAITISIGPRETKEVILFAKPRSEGMYTVEAIRWRLGDHFQIREPLKIEGPLLQKTLKQRLERLRGEDTRLSFEVVHSTPLLRMTLSDVPSTLLHGEVILTKLTIRNEGNSTARDIRLKSSHPCFVYMAQSRSESILPFTGHSCTVVHLPRDMTIAPGQTVTIDAWMRLTSFGKQNISILAAYLGSDGCSEVDDRSSFVAIQTVVVPSMSMDAKVIPKPASTTHKTLIVDLTNEIASDSSAMVYNDDNNNTNNNNNNTCERVYSLAESPSEQGSWTMSEGQCVVDGVWILGCGRGAPIRGKMPLIGVDSVASPSERVSLCLPLAVSDTRCDRFVDAVHQWFSPNDLADNGNVDTANSNGSNNSSNSGTNSNSSNVNNGLGNQQLQGHQTWLLEPRALKQTMETNNATRIQVLERFLCAYMSSGIFIRELNKARIEKAKSDEDAEATGPRTISQVRKERQKEQGDDGDGDGAETSANSDSNNSNSNNNSDSSSNNINNYSGVSNDSQIRLEASTLAQLEAREGCVTVVVTWKCCKQGSMRYGMSTIHHLSLLSAHRPWSRGFSTRTLTPQSSSPADRLLVGIDYPRRVQLPARASSCHELTSFFSALRHVSVPVTMELRSVSDRVLVVSVEAIDRKEKNPGGIDSGAATSASSTAVSSNPIMSIGSDGVAAVMGDVTSENHQMSASMAIAKTSAKGLHWHGKTKHLCFKIEPFSSVKVPFLAVITKAGVIDIKRFKISVSEVDLKANAATSESRLDEATRVYHLGKVYFKAIPGQCLVEVTS